MLSNLLTDSIEYNLLTHFITGLNLNMDQALTKKSIGISFRIFSTWFKNLYLYMLESQ